jgi:hypothetical protein
MGRKPVVHIAGTNALPAELIDPVIWGLEEEGVPWESQIGCTEPAHEMAKEAADTAPLNVGIGIDAAGPTIVLHHRDLPKERPLLTMTGEEVDTVALRRFGANAARLVKGLPLILEDEQWLASR